MTTSPHVPPGVTDSGSLLSSTPAVVVRDLGVELGGSRLLDGVDLDVACGAIVAVVGSNGAGKTTLLDSLTGDVPTTGTIRVGRVARVFQGSPLPDTLTVAELLELACRDADTAEEVAARFGLTTSADRRVVELSTGMRRILDLACSSIGDPDVLLLDEPASGLAAAEVELLADLIREYRDRTGSTVVLVEHDLALVEAVADEVVVLDHGRVVRHGPSAPAAPVPTSTHVVVTDEAGTPATTDVRARLAAISEAGVPAAPAPRHAISTWTKLRLGLREFAAGMASVLILGVLNRVMKVELGISLVLVAAILASYNLAAPVALWIGHRSDQRPIAGRHRSPYILGGAALVALAVTAAPHLADRLAAGVTPGTVALTVATFVVMGVGMYGAGTVYFALIADLTPRHERAHAASVVYLMLMMGIIAGAVLAGTILDDAAQGRHALFAVVGVLVLVCNVAAVWGLDPEVVDERDLPAPTSAWAAISEAIAIRSARRFFLFMLLTTVFLFLQQAVLEPYGGDVLGLSVRATTGFNAVQTIGVLVGMLVTGRGIADRQGHKRTALVGLVGSAGAFAALAAAALVGSVPASWFAILMIGLTTGLFSVAVLALMMAMSVPEKIALFMGAWTVSHALADGVATAGGGLIHKLALVTSGSEASAYAMVFGLEAAGLLACIPILLGLDVTTFAREVAAETARRSAAAMGWVTDGDAREDPC